MKQHRGLFKKGDPRTGKGGKRKGAGRPTKEQIAEAKAELRGYQKASADLEEKIGKQTDEINNYYLALAKTDPATLRHLIDRFAEAAKQKIDITGHVGITIVEK